MNDDNFRPGSFPLRNGVIFSLEGGDVWLSWKGQDKAVRLGSLQEVSEMMRDFLRQIEIGKRLDRYN